MAYLWTVTLGYVISFGLIARVFFYFLRIGPLNPEDSKKIDSLKQPE